MKLKLNAKNPRIITDEMGNELFSFTGNHLEDLREILARVNDFERCVDDAYNNGFNENDFSNNVKYYKNRVGI